MEAIIIIIVLAFLASAGLFAYAAIHTLNGIHQQLKIANANIAITNNLACQTNSILSHVRLATSHKLN